MGQLNVHDSDEMAHTYKKIKQNWFQETELKLHIIKLEAFLEEVFSKIQSPTETTEEAIDSMELDQSMESMFSVAIKPYSTRNIVKQPTTRPTVHYSSASTDK